MTVTTIVKDAMTVTTLVKEYIIQIYIMAS